MSTLEMDACSSGHEIVMKQDFKKSYRSTHVVFIGQEKNIEDGDLIPLIFGASDLYLGLLTIFLRF